MIIRDATFSDLQHLLPMAREAHLKSMFAGIDMNEAIVQRNFVVAIEFDNGYAKVTESDGEVVGGLVGIIAENYLGILCAQDMFAYSRGGTRRLVNDFFRWARSRGAQFAQITDLTNNARYQKLCSIEGFKPAGLNMVKVM